MTPRREIPEATVALISLGAPRPFSPTPARQRFQLAPGHAALRPKGGGTSITYLPGPGTCW